MLVNQLLTENCDLIGAVLTESEFKALGIGDAIFVITTWGGSGDIFQQKVRRASYHMVVREWNYQDPARKEISTLSPSQGGYASAYSFSLVDLKPGSKTLILHAKPTPAGDNRWDKLKL